MHTEPRARLGALLAAAALALPTPALADAGHAHGDVGAPGRPGAAARTVEVVMGDMYFRPATLRVGPGETVRFVVRNSGEVLHEFNIGTPAMHAAHRKEMAAMAEAGALTPTGVDHAATGRGGAHGPGHGGMSHDDPNSVLVEPGKTAELTWTFPQATTLEFACNVPGHSEAGMVGKVTISR